MQIRLFEFVAACRRVLPALSQPVIAIANSAGPDSTCLLFLLRQLFPAAALLSVHVRHDLQPAAPHMAAVAAANARRCDMPHLTLHIPWGVPPFPSAPTTALERTARDARYNVLFHAITRARAPLLALAHHADDQLETAILRLAHGSSLLGAAGMRPSRRWGMGSLSPLASFGHHGLNAFIVRPLLPFPKDRILATCHAHHLQYVDDPTNYQPHITARNTIRHCLRHDPPFSLPVSFPPTASLSFAKARDAFLFLRSIDPASDQNRPPYSAVAKLATAANDVDRKVTIHLTDCVLPSPIGTLLLSSQKLLQITDPNVRFALVLRVMRYTSFHPWGSLRADADRRQQSIHRIMRALWPVSSQPFHYKKFTAGGGVLWSPAVFNPNKALRSGNYCVHSTRRPHDCLGWLASRLPPFLKNPQQGAGSPSRLLIDLTEQLRAATISSHVPVDPLQILYDCRFLLRIDPFRMPAHVKAALEAQTTSIRVLPFTQYYWPKVVLQHESGPDQVLAVPQQENMIVAETTSPSWISIRWVRPLDAT